ncbi:MAG: hypothetical protein K2M17_04895 [Bacilli bacterium]|nr:hypothetical protein [Bacilli bacterium]
MDFLDFIESEIVRNHVRETGYKLTPKDAACIVYNSNKPLKEKHQAYRKIIETMPDCKIYNNGIMLHSTLMQHIKTQLQLIDMFTQNDNSSFYQCSIYNFGGIDDENIRNLCSRIENTIYETYDACLSEINEIPNKYVNTFDYITIHKTLQNHDTLSSIGINLISNSEIDKVYAYYVDSEKEEKENHDLWAIATLELNKNFPIPFKTGDIISCEDITPLQDIAIVNIKTENKKQVYGFYAINKNFNPQFIEFVPYSLLKAELINKDELSQDHYIEIAISELLKNEIDLGLFIKVYNHYKQSQTAVEISDQDIKQLKKHGIKIK